MNSSLKILVIACVLSGLAGCGGDGGGGGGIVWVNSESGAACTDPATAISPAPSCSEGGLPQFTPP